MPPNSDRDFIKVHLYSRHLIQKRRIYEVEGDEEINCSDAAASRSK